MIEPPPSYQTQRGECYDFALRHFGRRAARDHLGRRRGAAGAAERSPRARALPLRAFAARPFHAAGAAGQAAAALVLRAARRLAGKTVVPARPLLLSI